MTPDFNKEFKSFPENSKTYAKLVKSIHADNSYVNATEKIKVQMDGVIKAVFESVVIFSNLVPNQVRAIMRGSLEDFKHDLHSLETRKFIKYTAKNEFDHVEMYAKNLTLVALSRPGVGKELNEEVQSWNNPVKKVKP
jgi:hypothetical protein